MRCLAFVVFLCVASIAVCLALGGPEHEGWNLLAGLMVIPLFVATVSLGIAQLWKHRGGSR